VADVVGPGDAGVGLAGEGLALRGGLRGPGPGEAGGGEGAEVAAAAADGLDDHEVLGALAGDGVDLDGLEEVVGRVAHDGGGGGAEAAGELLDGHAGPVDLAVVAGEEEVHGGVVADDRLVDAARAGARDLAGEQGLRGAPAVGVGRVRRRAVREGRRPPLVREHPDALGREVEERRRHGGRAHPLLRRRRHLGPVGEQAEHHGPPVRARVVVGRVHEVLPVVDDIGEVLEGRPAGLGRRQRAR